MTCRGRLGSSTSAIETPGARKAILSACRFGLDSANGVSRDQATVSENKRNTIDAGAEQGEIARVPLEHRLLQCSLLVAALPVQISGHADQHDCSAPECLGRPCDDRVQRPRGAD